MTRPAHVFVIGLLAIAALAIPGRATADKNACLVSVEKGQTLRDAGKLRDARDQFVVCASKECPRVVQTDCARWAGELEASIPTVVCVAEDANGDVTSVRVRFDGAPWLDRLDGKAVAIDPGMHVFTFEHEGTIVESRVLVGQGEKNKRIAVRFDAARPAASATSTTPLLPGSQPLTPSLDATTPPPPPPATRNAPVAAIVTGGVGLVAIGAFAYLGVKGKNDLADLRSHCAPVCSDAEISSTKRELIAADISLGVGVVALGLSAFLFLSGKPSPAKTSVTVAPLPGGATAAWRQRF